jgi:hypothetical protein
MKNMSVNFEKAWLDIYFMLEDNALDSLHIMYLDDGTAMAGGARWEEMD